MSRQSINRVATSGIAIAASLLLTATIHAQNGSQPTAPSPQPTAVSGPNGITSGNAAHTPVGLQGYCPVCLVEKKQWVKGDAGTSVVFDGKKYLLPGIDQAQMFRENPAKYVPVLGGDDVVHYSRTGKRVEGNLSHGVLHDGRHYFFASAETMDQFRANPNAYVNADLAIGGECAVCRVAMNHRVAGSPEFTVIHNGLRYQFPAAEQQAAFQKSPDKYAE